MKQTFVKEFSVEVIHVGSSGNTLVYSNYNNPIATNGIVNIWDGSGAIYTYPYRVNVNFIDCNGNNHFHSEYPVYCYLKSVL